MLLRTTAIENPPAEGAAPEAIKASGTKQLGPGPIDGSVAYVAARLLERHHYRQHEFDDEISEKFLDRYLDAFDPQHIHFTEADLAEFGAALSEVQRVTGGWFADAQGGVFAPGQSGALVERLREWGATGVGQSSWGPAVYGLVADAAAAGLIAARARGIVGPGGVVYEGPFSSGGARIGWGAPSDAS